ncbi:MAG: hypothetical protein IJM45_06600 [Clostridia bacterium]|nr:hypothetical protein [Clostridia bacterium]
MKRAIMIAAPALLFVLGVCLVVAGIADGGFADVLEKARMICFECIGIG